MRYKDRAGTLIVRETGQDKFLRFLYGRKAGRLLLRLLMENKAVMAAVKK